MEKEIEMNGLELGDWVCTRANLAGVTIGILRGFKHVGQGLCKVELEQAYRIHGWKNTASTFGLAYRGPGEGSRVPHPTERAIIGDAFEIIKCTNKAVKNLKSIQKWTYGDDDG